MTIFHAIVLGVVQGVTEALPISSSAHLVIIPWLCRWPYQGLAFDIALHFGTAVAFIIYFFKDWTELVKGAFSKKKTQESNLLWYIVIATIPAALAGLVFEKYAERVFRHPLIIVTTLALFAIFLWLADRYGKKVLSVRVIKMPTALLIGCFQALAIIPGVSRSGITITAGLFKGLTREAAARFSFLIATPIVLAAAGLSFLKLRSTDMNVVFFIGVFSSAISGFFSIKLFLHYVRRSSLGVFVVYRLLLASMIAIAYVMGRFN